VFSAGKKESTQPFFFQKTPICLFQAYAYLREALSFGPEGTKKGPDDDKIVRETTTTLFFLLSSFPHTRF
jgi:hypothetical protein